MCWQKTSGMSNYLISPTGKEVKHMYVLFGFMISVNKITDLAIDFGLNHELYGSY